MLGPPKVLACTVLSGAWLSVCATGQSTIRVDVSSAGAEANGQCSSAHLSADGRRVAFAGIAGNLVAGDTNNARDAFVRDVLTGQTTRVSVDSAGAQANSYSGQVAISADGLAVAFDSLATNLVAGDSNGVSDVFLRDLQTGQTSLVSVSSSGVQGNLASGTTSACALSQDGRYVAFVSDATNLALGDANGVTDVFVRDRTAGLTTRVSVDSSGLEAIGASVEPALSGDGRYVAFTSFASNLVAGDTNGLSDIFVHDRQTGVTTRVSVDSAGAGSNGSSLSPAISADGRWIAFSSSATNLVAGDTNGLDDVFLHDRQTAQTILVSLDSAGAQADGGCSRPSISANGRYVAFDSWGNGLAASAVGWGPDVFVRDVQSGLTSHASVDSAGAGSNSQSQAATISADGRYVAFASDSNNLVPGDNNLAEDVFLRDRGVVPPGSVFCVPGVAGVLACACGNPNGAGRGCGNTGSLGARLDSAGVASLAADAIDPGSWSMTGTDMLSGSTCIFLQGNLALAGGANFGAGIRCAHGVLKRLYLKGGLIAAGGTMSAPQGSDRSISNRSSDLGLAIAAGQILYYQVYYRDPSLANPGGACPGNATFDVTSGLQVGWTP